jgi:hypothetical protein
MLLSALAVVKSTTGAYSGSVLPPKTPGILNWRQFLPAVCFWLLLKELVVEQNDRKNTDETCNIYEDMCRDVKGLKGHNYLLFLLGW